MDSNHKPEAINPEALRVIAAVWPGKDRRHHAYLALAGGLLRSGWSVERVEILVDSLAAATRDEERSSRVADVRSTATKIRENKPAFGWPNLAKLLRDGWSAVADIRHALGLTCTLAELAEAKGMPLDFLRGLGVKDREGGGVEIPYRDLTGKTVAFRTRDNLVTRPRWPKGQTAIIYGEDRLPEATAAGYAVLVEGESDSWTLWFHGQPALGIPGAECAKVLQVGHVAGLPRLYLFREPYDSGEAFEQGIRRRLADLGWAGELYRVILPDRKDPNELHAADPEAFPARWREALDRAERLSLPGTAARPALPADPPWPDPLAEEAYYGLAGEIVRVLEPASEADPAALLLQTLVGVGNLVGRTAHCVVESDRHFGNEFLVLVGKSSKSRKGTSWGRVQGTLRDAEEKWAAERVQTGLSSGEGLIWGVRDPVMKREKVKERGQPVRYEEVEADPGIADKRLLVYEPEYANVLKQTERQGNILSAVLRQAWESGDLATLAKNSPAKATGAHVSLIGHITKDELRRYLTTTEMANGFGNRHLWACVLRSKELPEGGRLDDLALDGLKGRLAEALAAARCFGAMRRDEYAREIWREVYGELSADRPGLTGALLGRAEAHVLRLSLLYALLDCSPEVRAPHLMAALAVWEYCEQSVRHVFGDALGDPVADELMRLLRAAPGGMSRWEMTNALGRNVQSDRIGRALALLAEHGLAHMGGPTHEGRGRPEERWFAGRPAGR
jgi:hypothetical protein